MEKIKIHMEYPLKATSKQILWMAISSASGLEGWFADKVVVHEKHVDFYWGKDEKRNAEIVGLRVLSFVRFRWTDAPNHKEYFEIKMTENELTSDHVLEITDFAEPAEVDDLKELWDMQVSNLRRTCGF